MIRVLEIVATSWPIAVVLIAAMAASIALYVVRWFKQSDIEDKAYRSKQAVVVRKEDY